MMQLPYSFDISAIKNRHRVRVDYWLLLSILFLLGLGVVMVASSSIVMADKQLGDPFYYAKRQGAYAMVGILLAYIVAHIRMEYWQKSGMVLMAFAIVLLALVLIPGIGKSVNGSMRWVNLGVLRVQVSEPARLFLLIYLAGYLVRRHDEVRQTVWGFMKPMLVFGSAVGLIVMQPDFGSAVVLLLIALGTMFIAGARLWQFFTFLLSMGAVFAFLAVSSPYRMQRLTTFLNPWADPYDSGFQLTQSLIAFGSGGVTGAGLGGSIQKFFYLPEAHNDFLFAVLAEELGMLGVLTVLAVYVIFVVRSFCISSKAERSGHFFGAYLSFSIALWFAAQAIINMGVNMGILPTKGLTLPLMSSGGSSLLVMCIAFGMLIRVHHESNKSAVMRRSHSKILSKHDSDFAMGSNL